MQPLQICIGPIIRIGRESWCLPYVGFFLLKNDNKLITLFQTLPQYIPNSKCILGQSSKSFAVIKFKLSKEAYFSQRISSPKKM